MGLFLGFVVVCYDNIGFEGILILLLKGEIKLNGLGGKFWMFVVINEKMLELFLFLLLFIFVFIYYLYCVVVKRGFVIVYVFVDILFLWSCVGKELFWILFVFWMYKL